MTTIFSGGNAAASGGGAVTVANGADVAEGSTTDAAITSDSNGTVIGFLRGLAKLFGASGAGGYIRQDSTGTIAKETGGNLATLVTNQSKSHNTAAPGATNLGVLPAVATAAAPTFVEGNQVGLSTDLTGAVRIAGSFSSSPAYATRSDTFTGIASGTTVDRSTSPLAVYGLQVKGTGGVPTSWDVRLEGSLDNVNFSTILQHTQPSADGAVVWSGTTQSPALYFRSRVAGLVLGLGATNIVVTILGKG